MKDLETGPLSSNRLAAGYSLVFSVLTLALLFSFIAMPGFSLAKISSNTRWRTQMIDLYNSLRLRAGDRVFNETLIGQDGWIFYMDGISIPTYQKTNLLKQRELVSMAQQLEQLRRRLKSRGILLVVVIPPDKSTIYPQYMPGSIAVQDGPSRLDQFVEYMRKNGKTRVVDLRPALLEASREQQVYYKTDSHWNDLGAYLAYQQIMSEMTAFDPRLAPHPLSDFRIKLSGPRQRDLSLLMGTAEWLEEAQVLIPRFPVNLEVENRNLSDGTKIRKVTNADTSLPELLVFHDSFYDFISKFLEPHFSRIMTIPVTEESGIWSLDWVEKRNPDVVIIEIVERNLSPHIPLLLATQHDQ